MNYTQLAQEIFETAKEKGFWDKERNKPEMLMLIVSELSEAFECDRKSIRFPKNHPGSKEFVRRWVTTPNEKESLTFETLFVLHVKDTLEDELADAAIRILDTVRGAIEGTNETIERLYLDNEPFESKSDNNAECLMDIVYSVSKSYEALRIYHQIEEYINGLIYSFKMIEKFAEKLDIDLEWHIRAKMDYNKTRPFMHNKKY